VAVLRYRNQRQNAQPYLDFIGGICWLLGQPEEAIRSFKAAVDGILDRSIKYADVAGGVSQGLLLWYAGVTAHQEPAKVHATDFLGRLARGRQINYWPGPLALLLLGHKTAEQVLFGLSGCASVSDSIERAQTSLLIRRRLAKALFYIAAQHRGHGAEQQCRRLMAKCCSIPNPVLEIEWYLASWEANGPASRNRYKRATHSRR
jgi:hypothetical protein